MVPFEPLPGGFPAWIGLESIAVTPAKRGICGAFGLWLGATAPGPALGEGEPDGLPPVRLERLYQLPSQTIPRAPQNSPAALDREEWVERFRLAHSELDLATLELRAAQEELEGMAAVGESWQLAAPGASAGAENSPVSYRLRQEIRRHRESQRAARAKLTELRVEASLAGVPPEWQEPQGASSQDRLDGKK